MKALIATVLALAIPASASAERRTYDVKATRPSPSSFAIPSCEAIPRMLRDKHTIIIDELNDVISVDGFRWKSDLPVSNPDLLISFHAEREQKTYLLMNLYVNQRGLSGIYILTGFIPDEKDAREGVHCQDTVYIDGTRR